MQNLNKEDNDVDCQFKNCRVAIGTLNETYCSMSQYFIRPSLPALTMRPASFFPFTIMNFSLIDSILKNH